MTTQKSQPATHESRIFMLALGLLVGFVAAFVLFLSRVPVDGVITQYKDDASDNSEIADINFDYYSVLEEQQVARRPDSQVAAANPTIVFVESAELAESSIKTVPRIITQSPITEPEITKQQAAPQSQIRAVPAIESTTDSYFVEAGNYRNNEDALQVQSLLHRMGLQAFVVVRQDVQGRVGHRVRVGPIVEQVQLDATRSQLRATGLEPRLIRVKGT